MPTSEGEHPARKSAARQKSDSAPGHRFALQRQPRGRAPEAPESEEAPKTSRRQRVRPQIEPGQVVRAQIESVTNEGECLVRIDGYVVFVAGGIPGEFVDLEILTVGRDYARGRVVNVSGADRFRTKPKCRHFGVCGGCQWQHIEYDSQLHWKEKLLAAALEREFPTAKFPIHPMLAAADPWGTRNKIHYQIGWFDRSEGSQLLMGHNQPHSPELEPIFECPVHHPAGDKVARLTFQALREREIPISDAHSVKDGIKSVLVRTSGTTGKSHVVLVATGEYFKNREGLAERLLKIRGVEGVHLNLQPDPGSKYLGDITQHLAGEARLLEEIGDVRFQVSPDVFFQTNTRAAQALYNLVFQALAETSSDPILDLYAGVGLFALPLAKRGRTVVAVESEARAVEDGKLTAQANGITTCEFLAGRVEHVVKELPKSRKFQAVILDPPREGCAEWILRLVGRGFRPKRIVYVSCNPAALGRDLALLGQCGYRISDVTPIDMFPHTSHIESVTVLNRK